MILFLLFASADPTNVISTTFSSTIGLQLREENQIVPLLYLFFLCFMFQVSLKIIQEGDGGFVEFVYNNLAPKKLNGEDISVFWDQQCLNYGQDWEEGFIHALTSSTAIILIMSDQVIE
jgi:hypothetical protein